MALGILPPLPTRADSQDDPEFVRKFLRLVVISSDDQIAVGNNNKDQHQLNRNKLIEN